MELQQQQPLLLNGEIVATEIRNKLRHRIEHCAGQGVVPCLATILVGEDPASETYVKMKGNACRRLGMRSERIHLPYETTTAQLIEVINGLNDDPQIHGILLQHPVPPHIDERAAFEAIRLEKDVDGVTILGFGHTAFGLPSFAPCTPQAIITIMDHYHIDPEGKHVVVIGRSPILGKPVSLMLMNRNATVTVCHSKTEELERHVRSADIVVAAVGKPKFVQGSWIKPGAVILDAGYNKGNIGDVDYEACLPHVAAITPVPGGIGPVTIATLLANTVTAAERTL